MKLVIVSDTHLLHDALGTLSGDVLIHCGDFASADESASDREGIDRWLGQQRFRLILCVGGNHDFELERLVRARESPFVNARLLMDEAIEFEGVKFYGSPWIPELFDYAFVANPTELEQRWAAIPDDTTVLITHSPPRGILDRTSRGRSVGCPALRDRVFDVAPRVHCFGHVHASSGVEQRAGTTFVNASVLGSDRRIANSPRVVEL